MSSVGLILLAAGCSERLGKPKQLLKFEGETLLRRAALTAVTSQCHPVIVVLGAVRDLLSAELKGMDVHQVYNPDWKDGMSSSIRVGLEAIMLAQYAEVEAVVLMLCDQPLLTSAYLDAMIEAYGINGTVIASGYRETVGVPALFPRALFPELLKVEGMSGAKQLLESRRDSAVVLPFPAGAMDVDTEEDYERLVGGMSD